MLPSLGCAQDVLSLGLTLVENRKYWEWQAGEVIRDYFSVSKFRGILNCQQSST